jgi:hypothetical protein
MSEPAMSKQEAPVSKRLCPKVLAAIAELYQSGAACFLLRHYGLSHQNLSESVNRVRRTDRKGPPDLGGASPL